MIRPQRDNKKTVVVAADYPCAKTKYSSLTAVLKQQISNRRFLLKNRKTGGVLKSPIFKDMAVSWEVSSCPFLS